MKYFLSLETASREKSLSEDVSVPSIFIETRESVKIIWREVMSMINPKVRLVGIRIRVEVVGMIYLMDVDYNK